MNKLIKLLFILGILLIMSCAELPTRSTQGTDCTRLGNGNYIGMGCFRNVPSERWYRER